MIISTANDIPGKNYETLGLVMGSCVQAKHVGKAFMAGLNAIAGGEIKIYTDLLNECRATSINRMVEQARNWGADAIIAARFNSCSVMDGSSEVVAFGTAVKFIH